MTTFAGGMTPANFYAGLNYIPKVYDVKEYGAVGDNNTDDTVAIQDAINACITGGGGTVYFPNGVYVIGGALQTNIGGLNYKSQLYIPEKDYTDNLRVAIKLLGENSPNMYGSAGIGTSVPTLKGAVLRSTLVSATAYSYVLASKGITNAKEKNFNDCYVENLNIQVAVDGDSKVTLGGIDFTYAANSNLKNVMIFPYNTNLGDTGIPLNNCIGISTPKSDCEWLNILENVNVGGFETGIKIGEHSSLRDVAVNSCLYGFEFAANTHYSHCSRIGAYWCANDIRVTGTAYFKIDGINIEWDDAGKWYDTVYTILDAANQGHGEISYNIIEANLGWANSRFSKSGGANIQIRPIAFAAAASFTVTGARDETEGALKDLIAKLVAQGIIVDGTTAS